MTVLNYRVMRGEPPHQPAPTYEEEKYAVRQTNESVEEPSTKPVPWDSFLAKSKVPQGRTDELLTWISKVNQKRNILHRQKERDLRKEALLHSAKLSAVHTLQSMQSDRRRRWNLLKASQNNFSDSADSRVNADSQMDVESSTTSQCDCEACFLCIRHNEGMHGKCYCNVIFSPRPIFMGIKPIAVPSINNTLSISSNNRLRNDDELSNNIDNFLSSLSSRNSQNGPLKRKRNENFSSRKRCKA
eukprot:TRINITY_DN9522_c0_g1_i1.p1 TRINITY_DN9522_c0_g1~~TRINITY_DN9522_c0_g1_i1.p1  ORF type:complete len:244 (-),score=36.97 TRINITY_DN9522_c0_g1_i1:94-825(-)